MANKIKIKNSEVANKAPTPADLDRAELAINLPDKKIYTKDQTDNIIELGSSTPWWELQQDLGSVNGNITINTSNGRIVLMQVNGPITNVTINDPNNPKTGRMVLKFKTNGSTIDWSNAIDGWIGAHPLTYQAGTHIINLIKIDGKWTGEYEGSEIPKNPPFKMTVRTTTPSTSFTLPFTAAGTYNVQADWGDGSAPTAIVAGTGPELTHTYVSTGDYQITLTGTVTHISFAGKANSASLVISIDAWGDTGLVSLANGFLDCINLAYVEGGDRAIGGDTWQVTNMSNCFQGCTSLTEIPMIDTSRVTNIINMFRDSGLVILPKLNFDRVLDARAAFYNTAITYFPITKLPACTTMSYMFNKCTKLTSFPLISIPECTDLSNTWNDCNSLSQFPPLSIPKVIKLGGTWFNCASLVSFPPLQNATKVTNISGAWTNCSSMISWGATNFPEATEMLSAWYGCSNLLNFPLIQIPKCKNLSSAWRDTTSLTHFPLLNTASVTNIEHTWEGSGLVDFPLLNLSNVTTIKSAWFNCSKLVDFPITLFPKVTDASLAWHGCLVLKNIARPNMPLVQNLSNTWKNCGALSDTFTNWTGLIKFDAVTNANSTFYSCANLTGAFPMKNFSACTNVGSMFHGSGVTTIAVIDTSSVTAFDGFVAYSPITQFPAISFAGVTASNAFSGMCYYAVSLTTFPPNLFDTVSITTPNIQSFKTTALDAASKNNILASLVTSNMTNGKLTLSGGQPLDATGQGYWTTLQSKGWTGAVS